MWTVLSGDFDVNLAPEDCWRNVLKAASPGGIIVFHDSEKASKRMMYTLPKMLDHFRNLGYSFEKLLL